MSIAAKKSELKANPRRWLVTGAAGFIGSALVEELLALGQDVVGLDNFSTGHRHNVDMVREGAGAAAERFTFIEGDICDADVCARACEGVTAVLHQAALGSVPRSIEDPMSSHIANVNGFLTLTLAARDAGVKRMVYASSSSVYGDHPALPKVESVTGRLMSPYATTKFINELYAQIVQDCYGLEMIGLRYFNVFGRRQDPAGAYAAVIPKWIDLLLRDKPCVVFGDGTQSRDFCYIDNVVSANLLSATASSEATNRAYNVGCGGKMSLLTLFEYLRSAATEFNPTAKQANLAFAEERAGDIAHSQADISAAETALGYQAAIEAEEGLQKTVQWFARTAASQQS